MTPLDFLLRSNEEGVFIYKNERSKIKLNNVAPWRFDKEHTYIVYFRNLKCPACRFLYDRIWITYLSKLINLAIPIEVTCEYFAKQCNNEWAKIEFLLTDTHTSPTIMIIHKGEILFKSATPNMEHIVELLTILKSNESLGKNLMKLLSESSKSLIKEICPKILKTNLNLSEELMIKVRSTCKSSES